MPSQSNVVLIAPALDDPSHRHRVIARKVSVLDPTTLKARTHLYRRLIEAAKASGDIS
jgi:hypothetical protein